MTNRNLQGTSTTSQNIFSEDVHARNYYKPPSIVSEDVQDQKESEKNYPPSKALPKTLKCGAKQIVGRLLMLPTIIPSRIAQ